MWVFAVVTAMPFLLIVPAALSGGVWVLLALGYMTVLVAAMDRVIGADVRNRDPQSEFPAADMLLVCLAAGHFGLLALAVWAVGGASGPSLPERAGIAVTAGLVFGQISHPAAHELIHRQGRVLRRLGRLIYTSLLIGHHASAHLLVHHIYVGTDADPSSAPRGQGFYRFAARAWHGAFVAGLEAESRRIASRDLPLWRHPYALYLGGGALTLVLAWALAGAGGVLALAIMAAHAQLQIQMSDYVQHYGLRRLPRADGRAGPVGPEHSWNSPHVFSAALTLNAPRHSDHHVTPSRPYPALRLEPETMPFLPRPLPAMAVLALVPPVWFRLMDPRCDDWQNRAGGVKSR